MEFEMLDFADRSISILWRKIKRLLVDLKKINQIQLNHCIQGEMISIIYMI